MRALGLVSPPIFDDTAGRPSHFLVGSASGIRGCEEEGKGVMKEGGEEDTSLTAGSDGAIVKLASWF